MTGFMLGGSDCSSQVSLINNNMAHSGSIGYIMGAQNGIECIKASGLQASFTHMAIGTLGMLNTYKFS